MSDSSVRQRPLGSGFPASATALDVVAGLDLYGVNAIVTGGHSGVGLETTRALRSAGAQVVVPVRDPTKGRDRVADIDGVQVERMDLSDPASVRGFAENYLSTGRPLHVLVNSAGVMGVDLSRDARGMERHFAVNHLGHFQLVQELWPALRAAGGARVVAVSAWAHRRSPVVFDDLGFTHRPYEWMLGYAQSKTANVLHAVGITTHGVDDGIEGFALHPGSIIDTDLSAWASHADLTRMGLLDGQGRPVVDPDAGKKTVEQGASTQTWLATDPRLRGLGGVYAENNEISPLVELPDPEALRSMTSQGRTPVGVVPHAIDPDLADRLWNVSHDLTT